MMSTAYKTDQEFLGSKMVSSHKHHQGRRPEEKKYFLKIPAMVWKNYLLCYCQTYLWAQGCFLMKIASNKITVFLGSDFTWSMNANAAGVTNNFTHHMLCCFIFVLEASLRWSSSICLSAYGPFSDIIRPFIRCNWGWGLTIPEKITEIENFSADNRNIKILTQEN